MSNTVIKHGEIIALEKRALISKRYCTVTSAINREFWGINDDRKNSIYVGSYGRGTAITTSDIDILVSLPREKYYQYNGMIGNGQSRLLQAVRGAILGSYPRSSVSADGQVVKIDFSDGIKFEILPAFENWDGTFQYPDTNMGGNWKTTNPRAEQDAIRSKNNSSNGLLVDTCKHIRYVRDTYFSSYHLSGIVIDSFVYLAMDDWHWTSPDLKIGALASNEYVEALLDYYAYMNFWDGIRAPGSRQAVSLQSSYDCLGKVLRFIAQ